MIPFLCVVHLMAGEAVPSRVTPLGELVCAGSTTHTCSPAGFTPHPPSAITHPALSGSSGQEYRGGRSSTTTAQQTIINFLPIVSLTPQQRHQP